MEIDSTTIKADFANLRSAISFVFRSDRTLSLVRLGLIVIQGLLPLSMLYLLKLLVDGITGGAAPVSAENFSRIRLYALLFGAIFFAGRLVTILNQYTEEILLQKLTDFISKLIHEKSIDLDLAYYDNADYHDTFHRAQQEAGFRPVQIIGNLTGLTTGLISLLGVVFILSTLSWWVFPAMVLASLPALGARLSKFRALFLWRKTNTALFREAYYFSNVLTHRYYAKELRIFNLGEHFQKKFQEIREGLVKATLKISGKKSRTEVLSAFMETTALLVIILLLAEKSLVGAITAGSFVMYFEAFRRGQGSMQGVVSNLSGLYNNKLFLGNLFEFLALESAIKSPENALPFPNPISQGIRFENVSFAYPDSEKPVIHNLSFEATPGKTTLIQGDNGSGKTTLIKLLCRMYECQQGAIYIDGINIKAFDLDELRKNIGVIFQDFAQFDLSAKDNITLGDVENMDDFDLLTRTSRLSCADSVVEQLPIQYDTILGKYFKHGEELSMGQWQRIALGRALYNNSPILVLDEPTSWMDEKAEKNFFHNLAHLGKDRILLVISHSANREFDHLKIDTLSL